MRTIAPILIISAIALNPISFAQTTPQAPASWVAFQQQENAKRVAFNQQMKADREAFLRANPDVQSYLDQMRAIAKQRMATFRNEHRPKNSAYAPAPSGL